MNTFDVDAIGWVLLYNRRRIAPDELAVIGELSGKLMGCIAGDQSKAPLSDRLLRPRRIPLSRESEALAKSLLATMLRVRSGRLTAERISSARNHWVITTLINLLLLFVLPALLPVAHRTATLVGLTGLVATLIAVIVATHYARVTALLRKFNMTSDDAAGKHSREP